MSMPVCVPFPVLFLFCRYTCKLSFFSLFYNRWQSQQMPHSTPAPPRQKQWMQGKRYSTGNVSCNTVSVDFEIAGRIQIENTSLKLIKRNARVKDHFLFIKYKGRLLFLMFLMNLLRAHSSQSVSARCQNIRLEGEMHAHLVFLFSFLLPLFPLQNILNIRVIFLLMQFQT